VLQPVNPHHPYEIPDDSFAVAGSPRGLDGKAAAWVKYRNSLHYADAVLGMLVERMEREGLMDNTLFILVADHGEAFYQHRGNYGHPLFLYGRTCMSRCSSTIAGSSPGPSCSPG